MAYKQHRSRKKGERASKINASVPSKWRLPVAFLAVILGSLILAAYAFPAQWNATLGSVPSLEVQERPYTLGLDLLGGAHLVYEADLSEIPDLDRSESLNGVRDVIERRVNAFGVSEPVVQTTRSGDSYRVIVELAGVSDVNEAIRQIGETPILEFKIPAPVDPNAETAAPEGVEVSEDGTVTLEIGEDGGVPELDLSALTGEPTWQNTELSGARLKKAGVEFDYNTGAPYVTLTFDQEGGELFGEITKTHIGQRIAIFLDGDVISAPVVQAAIYGGEAIITGSGNLEEARVLAQRLNAGALPVPIELISQQTVGPTLGSVSLERSLHAGMIGLLLVIVFMFLYYRWPGFVSVLALASYATIVLAIFMFLPVTITLAGIAGLILSVGMAVDANVLIFERIKEELRTGRSIDRSIEEGFRRAWSSIRDGNVTTLIACVILYWFSSSFIQGFALTLAIGILTSMFTAIAVTRVFLLFSARAKFLTKPFLYGVKPSND